MEVDGRFALNPHDIDIDSLDLVSIGDMIICNSDGAQFNLTEGKEYKLLGYGGGLVKVKNDLGIEDWYSVDYFDGH